VESKVEQRASDAWRKLTPMTTGYVVTPICSTRSRDHSSWVQSHGGLT
jgi:hypothetical protein